MKKQLSILFFISIFCCSAEAQIDPLLLKHPLKDSAINALNMDAVYNRPLIAAGKLPVSLGGYVEANWQHITTEGVSEGHQFQFRRLSLFVASTIHKRIKFMSEIEFEPAEKEIAIEFAAIDIEFDALLNLRAGMILNPIGSFNQNHDGPKWEFTDRPFSATQLLPGTWSNTGAGLYGKRYKKNWMFGYEIYASGGFDNTVIENDQNRTYLPASKKNKERFEESASGAPLLTAKIAVRNNNIGEIGISYMGGLYNKWKDDGIVIDHKRRLHVFAIDMNTTIQKTSTFITGEWAWIHVDVPATYSEQFGKKQQGGFVDIVQLIVKGNLLGWKGASLNVALRAEYVDWNIGKFRSTNTHIGDELWSIMPAISFRPGPQTVLRLNYRHQRQTDILNNPSTFTAGFSFGISSYF